MNRAKFRPLKGAGPMILPYYRRRCVFFSHLIFHFRLVWVLLYYTWSVNLYICNAANIGSVFVCTVRMFILKSEIHTESCADLDAAHLFSTTIAACVCLLFDIAHSACVCVCGVWSPLPHATVCKIPTPVVPENGKSTSLLCVLFGIWQMNVYEHNTILFHNRIIMSLYSNRKLVLSVEFHN